MCFAGGNAIEAIHLYHSLLLLFFADSTCYKFGSSGASLLNHLFLCLTYLSSQPWNIPFHDPQETPCLGPSQVSSYGQLISYL